jgi:Ni/Fe-hydrogenase subunit HybB-like protein
MSFKKESIAFGKELIQGPRLAFKHHLLTTSLFVLAIIVFLGVAFYRFKYGLGVTGINDLTAWGVWTALKLFFVVSAGCGFVLTGMVYIFKMERFRPFVRSAALLGLIGYSTFALTLIFELGWPWRIVHPVWMHNYHSILFEVAWCVILYLTILTLEFVPNVFERFKMSKLLTLFKKLTPAFVITGIILSVLHQSSLGSLFVVAPYKMNHLWYSPWVGPFFIISAVFCGLALIIAVELLMSLFNKTKSQIDRLSVLGQYSVPILGLYLGFKIMDILERPNAREAFVRFDFHTFLLIVEIGLGILVPIILYSVPRIRNSVRGLGLTAGLVLIFGGALNRLNVSVIAVDHSPLGYTPTLVEYLYILSITIIAAGIYVITTRLFPVRDN